jgi:hypothetical protein
MKKLIKCPAKALLVNILLDQSKSKGLCGAPFTLSNGENRRSLSCFYQELFKKWRLAFLKKSDNTKLVRMK